MVRRRKRQQGLLVARLGRMAFREVRADGRGAEAGRRQTQGAGRCAWVICAGEERGLEGQFYTEAYRFPKNEKRRESGMNERDFRSSTSMI